MPRAKRGPKGRQRHNKILKAAKGYVGGRSKLIRTAIEAVDHAGVYAYRDRKVHKRNMRALWQTRIGAATRVGAVSYSRFIHGLKKANIGLDRKILAELALRAPSDFAALVTMTKQG